MAYVSHVTASWLTPTITARQLKLDATGSAPVPQGRGVFAPWALAGERGFGEPRLGDAITIVNPRLYGFNGVPRATGNYRPLVAQLLPVRIQG